MRSGALMDQFEARVDGLAIVEKPDMARTAWFLKDADNRILRSGVLGMGEMKTPGADQNTATTIECGSGLYAALMTKTRTSA